MRTASRAGTTATKLLPHGDHLDVPVASDDGGRADQASLLDRVVALLPDDALSPDVVAHRIVHGCPRFTPALLTDELLVELSAYAPLAPLHQPEA